MKVLVVYYEITKHDRMTISEHLYSFEKYSDHQFFYLNAFAGIPFYIDKIKFDVVLYHYTFLSRRWNGPESFSLFLNRVRRLKKVSGVKAAFPQDEYVYSDILCEFLNDFGVRYLFTCFEREEWSKIYPADKCGPVEFFTVHPGYIDEKSLKTLGNYVRPHKKRKIDVGYRARKLPFWLGQHGTLKWKLADVFLPPATRSGLKVDISNDEKKVFKGNSWYEFLSNCRVVLGCEGGASLWDVDGSIRSKVDTYVERWPDASFDEVEESCFKGLDNNISLFALSPRHFEACITKTCQVLVEGDYKGVFIRGLHYIELKKDWSNLKDVLLKIKDVEYCEMIAERAFRDIGLNKEFTYRRFVERVFESINMPSKADKSMLDNSSLEEAFWSPLGQLAVKVMATIDARIAYAVYRVKAVAFPFVKILGLAPFYRKIRAAWVKERYGVVRPWN